MAIGVSDYGASAWLGMLFGKTAVPAGYYVALLTGDPAAGYDGDLLTTVEVGSDLGYSRVLVDSWTDPESGVLMNAEEVDFGVPTGRWGIVRGYALCTAATSGQVYAFGEFGTGWDVDAGQGLVVVVGALQIVMRPVEQEIV